MKIQDITPQDNPTEITYLSGYNTSSAGGGYQRHTKNVTKKITSIENHKSMRYGGTVEQVRKTITTECGKKIRLFWFDGRKSLDVFSVYQPAK